MDDDSLLASIAGVPLTKMARIAVCLIWLGFWCSRVLLTDALGLRIDDTRLLAAELIGENPFDQGFSLCMIWLSVEVAAVTGSILKGGFGMLIAKTPKSLAEGVAEHLSLDRFRALVLRRLSSEDLEALAAEKRQQEEDGGK